MHVVLLRTSQVFLQIPKCFYNSTEASLFRGKNGVKRLTSGCVLHAVLRYNALGFNQSDHTFYLPYFIIIHEAKTVPKSQA